MRRMFSKMSRRGWAVLAALGSAALMPVVAWACADATCYPAWTLSQLSQNGCSSSALIAPGNDTRSTLLMLLHDRHGDIGRDYVPGTVFQQTREGQARPFDFATLANTLSGAQEPQRATDADGYPVIADGAGTRCQSNASGTAAFIAAVQATPGIDAREKAELTTMRRGLRVDCGATVKQALMVTAARSARGRAFTDYLLAANDFYYGDWPSAQTRFAALQTSDVPWVAEASRYNLARVAIGKAMDGAINDYGDMDTARVRPADAAAAERALLAYMNANPRGRYTVSARGLLRRVYWLAGNKRALADEFGWQFNQRDAAQRSDSLTALVIEADSKLLSSVNRRDVADPLLLATLDIAAMRGGEDGHYPQFDSPVITRAEIDGQRARFGNNAALFSYVQAAHSWFVAHRPADVLALIPANDTTPGYLGFSRRMLRAQALDATNAPGARAALLAVLSSADKPFMRGAGELALALHDEQHQGLAPLFAANSPVRDAELREHLLVHAAGVPLLRQQAGNAAVPPRERRVARFILLYKQLTRGRYADFASDLARFPLTDAPISADDYESPPYLNTAIFRWAGSTDFPCPALPALARGLAATPGDAHLRLCLGEFVRLNGLDPGYRAVPALVDDAVPAGELGASGDGISGTRFSRLAAYRAVIADARAGADDKAYALFRAVNCFAPSAMNGCDASEVPLATRRGWFNQLKRDYPRSRWAVALRYYW